MAEGIACRLSKRDMEVQALLDRFPVSQANELRVQVLGVQLPRFLPDFTRPDS